MLGGGLLEAAACVALQSHVMTELWGGASKKETGPQIRSRFDKKKKKT